MLRALIIQQQHVGFPGDSSTHCAINPSCGGERFGPPTAAAPFSSSAVPSRKANPGLHTRRCPGTPRSPHSSLQFPSSALGVPLPRLTQKSLTTPPLRTPLRIVQEQAKLIITGASHGYMRGLTAGGGGC